MSPVRTWQLLIRYKVRPMQSSPMAPPIHRYVTDSPVQEPTSCASSGVLSRTLPREVIHFRHTQGAMAEILVGRCNLGFVPSTTIPQIDILRPIHDVFKPNKTLFTRL